MQTPKTPFRIKSRSLSDVMEVTNLTRYRAQGTVDGTPFDVKIQKNPRTDGSPNPIIPIGGGSTSGVRRFYLADAQP